MSILSSDGAGWRPDNRREWAFVLLVVGVAALSVGLGTVQYVQANPGAPWQLEAAVGSALSLTGQSTIDADTTLRLPLEDAQYLNRAYRDLNTGHGDNVGEQGYCLSLVEDRLSVQQAGTLEASEEHVRYTLANCLRPIAGTAHFHPAGSRPVLSGPQTSVSDEWNDKEALLASEFELSCVQAGVMTTTPGEETRAFRCFTEPVSGEIDAEFPEVPVVIAE